MFLTILMPWRMSMTAAQVSAPACAGYSVSATMYATMYGLDSKLVHMLKGGSKTFNVVPKLYISSGRRAIIGGVSFFMRLMAAMGLLTEIGCGLSSAACSLLLILASMCADDRRMKYL